MIRIDASVGESAGRPDSSRRRGHWVKSSIAHHSVWYIELSLHPSSKYPA